MARKTQFTGPDNRNWTLESDLPVPVTYAWDPISKMGLCMAIAAGAITRANAIRVYGISDAELKAWQDAFEAIQAQPVVLTSFAAKYAMQESGVREARKTGVKR